MLPISSGHRKWEFSRSVDTVQKRNNANPQVQLIRRIPKQTLMRDGEKDFAIEEMSYNSACYELFLENCDNSGARERRDRLCDNAGDLRDVYKTRHDTSPIIRSAT